MKLRKNEWNTFGHEIKTNENSLSINLNNQVLHHFLSILERPSTPTTPAELTTHQPLHTLQAQICKYFTLHLPSTLSPSALQSLASSLFRSVHLE